MRTLINAVRRWLGTLNGDRPTMLDLFCCEGGAGMGYHRAGFDVFGVDTDPKVLRRYPFASIQADALDVLADRELLALFDAAHASPPCQGYSITRHTNDLDHPDLVDPVRAGLVASGLPYVIENVVGAPLRDPLLLCGSMLDLEALDVDGTRLRLQRHRLFESNVFLLGPGTDCQHDTRISVGGVYGGGNCDRRHAKTKRGGYTPVKAVAVELIGADWMTMHGLSQAIPPAYTQFIGTQLIEHLNTSGIAA